jgi:hypothetical protein
MDKWRRMKKNVDPIAVGINIKSQFIVHGSAVRYLSVGLVDPEDVDEEVPAFLAAAAPQRSLTLRVCFANSSAFFFVL